MKFRNPKPPDSFLGTNNGGSISDIKGVLTNRDNSPIRQSAIHRTLGKRMQMRYGTQTHMKLPV